MNPGMGSFQSANVRIGTLIRSAVGIFRLRRLLATVRMSLNRRSIVAALMFSNFGRISVLSVRWPLRSSAGTSIGNNALSRLPHTRSEALPQHYQCLPRRFIVDTWSPMATLILLGTRGAVEDSDGGLSMISAD